MSDDNKVDDGDGSYVLAMQREFLTWHFLTFFPSIIMNFMYSGLGNSTVAINNELTLFSKPTYYTSFLFNNE